VFSDSHGEVIVPWEIIVDVLLAAEEIYECEGGMRAELRRGVPFKDANARYGSI